MKFVFLICILCIVFQLLTGKEEPNCTNTCFSQLKGHIDDCDCAIDTVHKFNIYKMAPLLNSLLQKEYFRFFKVNLHHVCPFWEDDKKCSLRGCHVEGCKVDELPEGLRHEASSVAHEKLKYTKQEPEKCDESANQGNIEQLDTTLTEKNQQSVDAWTKHDNEQDSSFCELDDDLNSGAQYVDLLKNPERYTGYKGLSAHKIWGAIYKENCFNDQSSSYRGLFSKVPVSQCLEKRTFFRLISGLHTSINLHLCKNYLLTDTSQLGIESQTWGPNLQEFMRRFDPNIDPEGPKRLKNLYFTYLVELRALAKAAPFIRKGLFYTGNETVDRDTKTAVDQVLKLVTDFPNHFDESTLFRGDHSELKDAFKRQFRNITRIMDCMGCEKCKLWGKLQTQGMGTALKILFSGDQAGLDSNLKPEDVEGNFQLTRTEIVSLFNAFGRLTSSIQSLEIFKSLVEKNG